MIRPDINLKCNISEVILDEMGMLNFLLLLLIIRFTVGYLIWGYLIIYVAVVVVGIAIIFIRIFIGDKLFLQIFMRCIPVILVIIVKVLVNKIATNYAFMDKKLKVLALINFRAFNVFLYFNFYFDCFMGIISAVIRLILSLVISIFMMPSW